MTPKLIAIVVALAAVIVVIVLMVVAKHRSNPTASPPLTNEQKTKMAQEVLEGKRDPSELDKHGIRLGERKEIDPQEFLRMAEQQQSPTQPATKPNH